MKNCLIILLLFIWQSAFSQLNDNFNDGNFVSDPAWTGDISSFSVNNSGQLQTIISQNSQSASLATENKIGTSAKWEFFIRLDFDPSSTNRLRIYLLSDKEDLKGPLEGYFIQIGESGNSDSYDLYRQSGTAVTQILNGPDQARVRSDQVVCRLKITRDYNGEWLLSLDSSGAYDYKPAGTIIDKTFMKTGWFGVVCEYTPTRSDKFFLDDFKIDTWQSNLPPQFVAQTNDIVINEVFADPNPIIKLPDAEFIELWNRTAEPISLKNWTYSDLTSTFTFGNDSIRANEHLLLCAKSDIGKFSNVSRVVGISTWPVLNNDSDQLKLQDEKGRLINQVAYSTTWYQEEHKKEGGWSLEMIDPDAICGGIKNWKASNDLNGGTPGKMNSVYKLFDSLGPLKLSGAKALDSLTLSISFNRHTDSLKATNTNSYLLNNGTMKPLSAQYSSSDLFSIILKFATPFISGVLYKITAEHITDCSGSIISPALNTIDFFIPRKITEGDILISEILFNPNADGVDFVEIYNLSNNDLDIAELSIGNLPLPDSLNKAKRLSSNPMLIKPGEYLVLTSDPDKIKKEFYTKNPDAFLKVSPFPSFNNDQGIVTLLKGKQMIDQFSYTEKMHMSLIKKFDGISLERSDFKTPANEAGNFKSATASVGFATPGYKNSQYLGDARTKEAFNLVAATFSPDNDGFEDQMQINYLLHKPGFIANITVFNDRGIIIRKLYQNYSLGTSGTLDWDGRDETSLMNPAGIYFVYVELFNTDGERKKFRKTVVLASKLN